MKATDVLAAATDSMKATRVFAEPVERNGTTVIAAATFSGGSGAGEGSDNDGQHGTGGGFGLGAKPVGAFVIKDGQVNWQPAFDINRLMLVVGVVAVTALIVGARLARRYAE